MPNSNQNPKKQYDSSLCDMTAFYVPHKDANHLNAQDVIFNLVNSAKNISIASWNCFEDGEKLVMKGEIVANLIFEIQTKLEMIEKILPMAFENNEGNK
ncbi:hypothetical protein QAB16_004875 [Acinetobacter nosocomialis]|uniref:hypothetical protein n=1 Tax=Acinetobacter nosocomialis TaxID=106654 RepID=UPI00254C123A|nr:hypothetical protein [Acinetobacter nosocomialis]MEC6035998.1 hypothetical protein [Acinetobacter nosocomialis]